MNMSFISLLLTAQQTAKKDVGEMLNNVVGTDLNAAGLQKLIESLVEWSVSFGGRLIGAILIFIIGRFAITLIIRMLRKLMIRRQVEPSLSSFVLSMSKALLAILLAITIIGKLGIETTTFAALLASMGLAIGMAFSGNLQNFACGVIILLIKPYKVGDLITAGSVTGTVQEIQIFHTIMKSAVGEIIYIPNNTMMNNPLINITKFENRVIETVVGVDYGESFERVEAVIKDILASDSRILQEPAPLIAIKELADNSVNIMVRCHTRNDDYYLTSLDLNKAIYNRFNKENINFPYPQLVVHKGEG